MSNINKRIIRLPEIKRVTSLSRSTILLMVKNGKFPRSISLSDDGRAVGWLESDVQEWIDSRISATKVV
jgi:prophage regulatory protein